MKLLGPATKPVPAHTCYTQAETRWRHITDNGHVNDVEELKHRARQALPGLKIRTSCSPQEDALALLEGSSNWREINLDSESDDSLESLARQCHQRDLYGTYYDQDKGLIQVSKESETPVQDLSHELVHACQTPPPSLLQKGWSQLYNILTFFVATPSDEAQGLYNQFDTVYPTTDKQSFLEILCNNRRAPLVLKLLKARYIGEVQAERLAQRHTPVIIRNSEHTISFFQRLGLKTKAEKFNSQEDYKERIGYYKACLKAIRTYERQLQAK